jgi:hypothetical protein
MTLARLLFDIRHDEVLDTKATRLNFQAPDLGLDLRAEHFLSALP